MSDVRSVSVGRPAPHAMLHLQRVHLLGDDLGDEYLAPIGMAADALATVLAPPPTAVTIHGGLVIDDVGNVVVAPVETQP